MEITIRNKTCYQFEDVISIDELNLDQIDVKDVADTIYDINHKGYYGFNPIRVTINEGEGVINKDRYLKLFGSEKYNYIYNKISQRISFVSGIKSVFQP